MSSVTRFLKQLPAGGNQVYVNNASLANLLSVAFELVPTSGNVVGNYPPALMVQAAASGTGLDGQIANAFQAAQVAGGVGVLRDMGKTVFAQAATGTAAAPTAVAANGFSYFRQVQLLVPQGLTNSYAIGGTSGPTFGVIGQNLALSPYVTFYIPSAVAGIVLQPAVETTSVLANLGLGLQSGQL